MTAATEPHWRRLQHPAFCRVFVLDSTIVVNNRQWSFPSRYESEAVEKAVDEFIRHWREQYGVEIA